MDKPEVIGLAADVFEAAGSIMIAYAALSVHHRFRHEHKVDEEVFSSMKRERNWGLLGIALTLIGLALHILEKTS